MDVQPVAGLYQHPLEICARLLYGTENVGGIWPG